MITAQDLRGVMAMMPAFATPDAADIRARDTVAVDNLAAAVNRIIDDGVDVIATTGSFGEWHTLLPEEFDTIVRATVEVVNKRVPLFVGCTALNDREAIRKIERARALGAEGVLLGVPFYFPATVENTVRFYRDVATMFPDLAFMIYHNPTLFKTVIPVDAFKELVKSPNIVGMKDSHRDTRAFIELQTIIKNKISVFVIHRQYHPYASLGAAGLWSYECWMGPWPMLRLRDAVAAGDLDTAVQIMRETSGVTEGPLDIKWRETAAKVAIGYADYCVPGPLRPPFVIVPPDVQERAKARAKYWMELCARYRPTVAV
jgi:dihydrodipicolinate synthase/N-acetylneuraminate lyase